MTHKIFISVVAGSLACQYFILQPKYTIVVPKSEEIYLYNVSIFFLTQAENNETVTNPMWQILLKEYFFSSCSQSVICYCICYLVFF